MKKTILICSFFLIIAKTLSGQVAGTVPSGTTSINPNFSMSVSQISTLSKDSMDIDCDGSFDLIFNLYKGQTVVDGANTLEVFIVNPDFDFCSFPGNWADIMQFYSMGDTMFCTGQSTWNNDTIMLGNYGCMLCSENMVINNKYFAYSKNSSEFGWIRLSYNLQDMGSTSSAITLTVHEIVTDCLPNSIIESKTDEIKLAAINSHTLNVIGLSQISNYQIFSIKGNKVLNGKTSSNIDISSLHNGIWILRIDGVSEPFKFIKQ